MKKLRVLVADDHDLIQRVLVRLLEGEFEVVGVVSSGRELVTAALTERPDVIVSDVIMPGATGCQAMEELRHRGVVIPFVLISAAARAVQEWLDQGALCVVDKSDLHFDLAPAVRSAAAGEIYLSRRAVRR